MSKDQDILKFTCKYKGVVYKVVKGSFIEGLSSQYYLYDDEKKEYLSALIPDDKEPNTYTFIIENFAKFKVKIIKKFIKNENGIEETVSNFIVEKIDEKKDEKKDIDEIIKYFSGVYLKGYPGLIKEYFNCNIVFTKYEIMILDYYKPFLKSEIIFHIPYEKIEDIIIETKKEFDGKSAALGFFYLGVIGALAMSQKIQKIITLIVKGKDKNGNDIKVPIYFADIKKDIEFKEELLKHIHTADEDITI